MFLSNDYGHIAHIGLKFFFTGATIRDGADHGRHDYNERMIDKSAPQPIPITGLVQGTTFVREELHFAGGVRAHRGNDGWQVGPLLREGGIRAVGRIPDQEIGGLGLAMGLTLFGANSVSGFDTPLPTRIWTPLLGAPPLKHSASDSWGMISSQARLAGDNNYGALASNVAVSLRAAGLQLRNASDEYHKQLLAALTSGRNVGTRFGNAPMDDLHLAFHSVVMEMASARDYLAQVAARRVKAPDDVDALNRLKAWLKKSANSSALNDALVARLLEVSDDKADDPWLADITDYRNLFLHREHMGAMAKWLVVEEQQSPIGPVRTIMMAINTRPGAEAKCDALVRFVDLYARLCRLADFAVPLAPYAATPPALVATGAAP